MVKQIKILVTIKTKIMSLFILNYYFITESVSTMLIKSLLIFIMI